jgi:TRAP-type C4-dicarboxylate transport system substrate-binding protein
VEKRTNGKVKINFHPGASLLPAAQTYDSVVKGLADIGWSFMSYTRGKFPLTEVIDLPLGYQSAYVATKLANAFYKKFKPKEFDEAKVLYLHAHGPGILTTKKPVYKLEDLKGMKIRSAGLSSKIVQKLGGAPVGMPISESYDALSKGVAEGILIPVEGLQTWKIGEVTKYTTENYGSAYSTGAFVVMNKSKWNSLPPDIQKIIEAINEEWIERTGKLWDTGDAKGKEWALKQGHKFIPLSKEEDARWSASVKSMLDEYVKGMKEKGLPGDQALEFCLEYLRANQK